MGRGRARGGAGAGVARLAAGLAAALAVAGAATGQGEAGEETGWYPPESGVVELSNTTFLEVVQRSREPVMVKFYYEACKACQKVSVEYKKAAATWKDLKFGAVNVLDEGRGGRSLAFHYLSSQKLPNIRIFSPGSKVIDYQGESYEAAALAQGLKNAYPKLPNLPNSGAALEDFAEDASPLRFVLFTDKDKTPFQWQAMAARHGRKGNKGVRIIFSSVNDAHLKPKAWKAILAEVSPDSKPPKKEDLPIALALGYDERDGRETVWYLPKDAPKTVAGLSSWCTEIITKFEAWEAGSAEL